MEPVIIIENHIPFIKGVFDKVAHVRYLPPEEITPEVMHDADALITRTRTRCDERLLAGSRCKIIATATIGTDHIDLPYCESQGITVVNAPGCNAPAVAQYVIASILATSTLSPGELTLGIVGVGHVGTIVDRWARSLGIRTLKCDPPREIAENSGEFVSLDTIVEKSDIITFHTPHTREGEHKTHHLISESFLDKVVHKPLIINSARGPIADTEALLKALDTGKISGVIIDCWENEPRLSLTLLSKALIATPHIAGYSEDGKIRATKAVIDAVAGHFGLEVKYNGPEPHPVPESVTQDLIRGTYNPLIDTEALKNHPESFESLRNNYHLRPEP
ncbi:MAG: 4-phosphoerythronate dehydrogenase [Muribaculaceae bacterium]|nr:4-phosphoerythronate dehydrogenase [Muribaculaceae bacterium]